MAESEVVKIAREFRAQLARNEDEALRRMARYWVQMENELEPKMIALAQHIIDLEESGQSVPRQLYYNLKRYQDLIQQINMELPGYQMTVEDLITEMQRENFILGVDAANAGLRYAMPSDGVWNKIGVDAAQTVAGFAGNGAPLAQLLQHDYGDLAVKVTDALVSGVGLGKGAYAVARDMRDAMGMEFNRSVRIARTEINRAYRIANADQYRQSGVVTKVLRLCYPPTACFACLMLDGEECEGFLCDDHPNGKCTTVAVTIGGNVPNWQHGEQWLMEQDEADQRRIMGDGRYEMWKNGDFTLREMVEMKPNPIWGGSPQAIPEYKLQKQLEGLE